MYYFTGCSIRSDLLMMMMMIMGFNFVGFVGCMLHHAMFSRSTDGKVCQSPQQARTLTLDVEHSKHYTYVAAACKHCHCEHVSVLCGAQGFELSARHSWVLTLQPAGPIV